MKRISSRLQALLWSGVLCAANAAWCQSPAPEPERPAWAASLQGVLPDPQQVQSALDRLPAVDAARAGQTLGRARQGRLEAGPHEWTFKAGVQRRSERAGPRMGESDVSLERGVRSLDKLRADQEQGRAEVELAQLAFEDTWHESARALLKGWFEWLREAQSVRVLEEQAQLVERQWDIAQRRLKAGEAAQLEVLQAQAEVGRARASHQQARVREQTLRRELERRYPGLAVQGLPAALPPPTALGRPVEHWVERVMDDNHELALAQTHARLARLQAQRVALDKRADPVLGVRAARERAGQEQVLGVYLSLPLGGAGRRADEQAALAVADIAQQKAAETRVRVNDEAWRVGQQAHDGPISWQALDSARQGMEQAARLSTRAYELGEGLLNDALQARRLALEARWAAETARLEVLESQARLLLDAHLMWTPPEPTP